MNICFAALRYSGSGAKSELWNFLLSKRAYEVGDSLPKTLVENETRPKYVSSYAPIVLTDQLCK